MRRCAAGWDTACNWDLSMLNKVANPFEHALRSANIHANPFQPDALELLIQAGGGLPRTINHLAQRAWKPGLPKAVSMSLPRMFKPESIVCLGWLTCCRRTAPFNLKKRESSFMTEPITQNCPRSVRELHELYCHCTCQNLSLRFEGERLWYEFLRAGFNAAYLQRVIAYLQKEIRAARRNIGALELSNLLQLDRFEEDLKYQSYASQDSSSAPRPDARGNSTSPHRRSATQQKAQ
jgi:hypothetical protein